MAFMATTSGSSSERESDLKEPGYLGKLLPDFAPTYPESLQHVLNDVQEKILPGVTHWQSPNFFAYFPANNSIASFLGEMLSAALNIVGFSWITSPAATELETIVLDWLAKALLLPHHFFSTAIKFLHLWVQVGTTSSTAVDPLPALAKVTRTNNIWFHVDAAYAGSACICPEYRHFIDGVEEVDSFNMNAHKWFLTNFDCSLLWVKYP
ncbi:hypothetical protein KIW84_031900 [Lathyrus oleraceus]|uniref:Uncharacterized protein n=1 Tax=Pisum sativum TaxID=3888 RepID=A0A9D4XTQ2_PEA|nr:hypothetical protein KIW84_031900 [Pisum sativum]